MNSSSMDDKKLFQYFLTIFYAHYTSLMDILKKGSHLKSRSTLIIQRLKSVLKVDDSQIYAIDINAKECAKLYKKSIIVRTKADPQLYEDISVVLKSSNNCLLEMGANSLTLFEVKHRYEKENELRVVIEVCHNSGVIKKLYIIESEISGKVGLKKTIDCGLNQIHVYFEWILEESSCRRHLEDPLLIATHFSSILLALGVDYWTYFRIPFKLLAKNTESRVRQTMYSSLHEMSFILDRIEKSRQLVPLFRAYLKEVLVIDRNYFQNCIVFFNDIKPSERLEVILSLRPMLDDSSDFNQKLWRVLAKKLITSMDDFDIHQIRDHLFVFVLDLVTNEDRNNSEIFLELFHICANKLFPKDMSDLEDNSINKMVDNQISFLNNSFERLGINGSAEDNLLVKIGRRLVSDGILSQKYFQRIKELI